MGDWELVGGNYLLKPKLEQGPPRALIHFLGGAIVGAAPHVSYRYVLEELAQEGYLVVATPYQLSFDHLETCDAILTKFERIAGTLARTYGALPVVGVGHSTGALLQLLITSLFPDTPRAANALISYNNKPIPEAVPLFEEVVNPFFNYVVARNHPERRNGAQVISVALELAKSTARGDLLPPDDLLNKALKLLWTNQESVSSDNDNNNPIQIPAAVREAAATWTKAASPTLDLVQQTGLVPPWLDILEALDQIPSLMEEVADGALDFTPSPVQVSAVAKRAYRARQTLVVQYTEDSFDESNDIEELVRTAGQVIRNKRPMAGTVRKINLPGGHDTPLWAPPTASLATRLEDVLGPQVARDQLRYQAAHDTVQEIVTWLQEDCNI